MQRNSEVQDSYLDNPHQIQSFGLNPFYRFYFLTAGCPITRRLEIWIVKMADKDDHKFALYELFVGTAEKVSDRRAQANAWMLSVNSAIVALYGYLQIDKPLAVSDAIKEIWLWAIPIAGILVCIAWFTLLTSYRLLNRAKFTVLMEIEKELSFSPFSREEQVYKSDGRVPLSKIESAIPWTFAALYLAMAVAAIGT